MKYLAHINQNEKQSVIEHLENVAEIAANFCRMYNIPGIDIANYAKQVGKAHDIGKYSDKFQKKIQYNLDIKVDHSTAGARELCNLRMPEAAFAVAGHHGGLPNGMDDTGSNLIQRVQKRLLEKYDSYKNEIKLENAGSPQMKGFESAFFIRMLFSALVDADFLDTEKFMRVETVRRGGYDSLELLYKRTMKYIAPWRTVKKDIPEINKIRTGILECCIKKGKSKRGIFSLTVPTGGGKTVSSLAFAMEHAKTNKMDRIIYVIPYTSIIEQTVDQFRNILGNENVLAHYSDSLVKLENESANKDELLYEKHKLSTENWDTPVIVTTNVQFFESLFSNKTSKCRKLHNIANSVIIFDEAQMIPLNYLIPCTKAIRSLVSNYGVSAVLCTATQPVLGKWLQPLEVNEICENYIQLFQRLKRTTIKNRGNVSESQIVEIMAGNKQILTIVNTKKTAQSIYQQLPENGRFHLSTNMLPIHREQTILQVKQRLKEGKECRVIATSLVEAGVNIDFPVVMREVSGLDSVIQAAGRCNREGRLKTEDSIVWIFDLDKRKVPDIIAKNVALMEETMQKYQEYDDLDAMHYYFESLQMLDEESLDVNKVVARFETKIENMEYPFQWVGENFHIIGSETRMLIVPVDEKASELLDELQSRIDEQESFGSILRRLGIYSLNVHPNDYDNLVQDGRAYELLPGVSELQMMNLYTEDMGIKLDERCSGLMI